MHSAGLRKILCAFVIVIAPPASAEPPNIQSAKTSEAAKDAAPPVGVEEMIVYGVRPGDLAPISGATSQTIYTEDFVGENKSLADLLSETEGVSIRRFGGIGDRSEVTIRGSTSSQVAVTIDGVRANSFLTGGLNLSRVCLPLVQQIDITRGAGSLDAGSGAIGGVVNVVTNNTPDAGTRAELTGGAFDTYEGSVVHSGRIKKLDYTVGYCGFETEGDFDFARPVRVNGDISARFVPAESTRFNNDREQHAGTLALSGAIAGGTLRFSDYAAFSSGGEPGVDSDNGPTAGQNLAARSRDFSNLAQLIWRQNDEKALFDDARIQIYHRYEDAHFGDPLNSLQGQIGLDGNEVEIPIDTDTRLSTPGAKLSLRHRSRPFGQTNLIDFQVEAAHDQLRANNQRGRDRPRAGAALRETIEIFSDRVQLAIGARLDWADGFAPQILPSAGLVLEPFPWLRLRGHVGRAYRVPNFDELFHPDEGFIRGNPNLDPEDAWNFDAGIELAFDQVGPFTNVNFKASWFRRDIDESIIFALINNETIQSINTGPATSTGYELSASIDWTRYSRLTVNLTETDSRRDLTDRVLPGQAEREAFAKLRIGPENFWKLITELQHVGEILVSEGNVLVLPERLVWNASASIDLTQIEILGLGHAFDALWVFVEGNNLSDEAIRDSLSFPQPGRNFSAGLEIQF